MTLPATALALILVGVFVLGGAAPALDHATRVSSPPSPGTQPSAVKIGSERNPLPTRELRAPDLPSTPGLGGASAVGPYHFESTPLGVRQGNPAWLAYDAGTRSFYVAQNNSTVSVIPPVSEQVAVTIPVGTAPFGVAYDPVDARVFVSNSGSNNVSVISDATNRTVGAIDVGLQPYGFAYDRAVDLLFVADGGSAEVTVVNASTLKVVTNISVGTEPVGLAYDPVSDEVVVANEGSANVSFIDVSTERVVASVAVGVAPYGVAVDNRTGEIYVSDSQSGQVTAMGPRGAPVFATLAVGGTPEGLTYDWRNQTVWVADGSAFVVVINASQDRIVQDIFFDPMGAAYDDDNGDVCFTNAANATFQCVVAGPVGYSNVENLTFNETGLPAGTEWTVSVSGYFETGLEESSRSPTIVFQVFYAYTPDFTVVPIAGYSASPSSGATSDAAGGSEFNITFTPAPGNYTMTFLESGIKFTPWSSPIWGVTFGASESQSSGPPLVFPASNGSYPFTIAAPTGYTATPSSGTVSITGGPKETNVTFVANAAPTYFVTFLESGLGGSTLWGVTLNGSTASGTGSELGFALLNGSYSFEIDSPTGYAAVPANGTIQVDGTNVSQDVSFELRPAPLVANFTYEIEYATCLASGGVTNLVALNATATGGTAPYTYRWTLPTGTATGPNTTTTTTWPWGRNVSLTVTDATSGSASHSLGLPMELPPCPPPAPGGQLNLVENLLGPSTSAVFAVGIACAAVVAAVVGAILIGRSRLPK